MVEHGPRFGLARVFSLEVKARKSDALEAKVARLEAKIAARKEEGKEMVVEVEKQEEEKYGSEEK